MNQLVNHRDYLRIEQALHYLHQHRAQQPSLQEVAEHVHLSEYHFQRLFSRWAGISPKRFLQFLNKEYLKAQLLRERPVQDATLAAGLSGGGRSHELLITTEAISPAQYRNRGRDLLIYHGFHDSPFGDYLLGITRRGICHMAFVITSREQALQDFREEWPFASLQESPQQTLPVHDRIFNPALQSQEPLHLVLRGSNFQLKVWEALLQMPAGAICHYEQLAGMSGNPAATRAAASAVARNRIALLIPCHRVIRKLGESGEYRWGQQRKRIMLAWEALGRSD